MKVTLKVPRYMSETGGKPLLALALLVQCKCSLSPQLKIKAQLKICHFPFPRFYHPQQLGCKEQCSKASEWTQKLSGYVHCVQLHFWNHLLHPFITHSSLFYLGYPENVYLHFELPLWLNLLQSCFSWFSWRVLVRLYYETSYTVVFSVWAYMQHSYNNKKD